MSVYSLTCKCGVPISDAALHKAWHEGTVDALLKRRRDSGSRRAA
jgi:hypothetical protein